MTDNMVNNKGFTLIEILIVIIVLGILSIFGFQFLSTSLHTYSMMEKQKGLFDQATMVMERISRELRDAESISSPTSGNTSYAPLTFTKSHGTDEDSSTDISFELSGSTLRRVGTATVNLADNVDADSIPFLNNSNEITITLTLESGEANITLQSYIYPKNLAYPDPDAPSGRNFGGNWEENIQ